MKFIQLIINLFDQHPFWATAVSTWVTNTGANAFVSSLPAPTKDSSASYVFWFKFLNRVITGNFARANGAAVESSPNFIDAVNKLQATTGGNIKQ